MAEYNMDNVFAGAEIGGFENEPQNDLDEQNIDPDVYFDDSDYDNDESGEDEDGSQNNNNYGENEQTNDNDGSSSSTSNLYRSVASALSEDGILTIDGIDGINTADGLREAINAQIQAGISEQNRRIQYALDSGVRPDEVIEMEGLLNDLKQMQDHDLSDESDSGVENRKAIIYNGCIAQGMSDKQAQKEVAKSFKAGTDIDDARYHLDSMIKSTQAQYTNMVSQRQREREDREASMKRYSDNMYNSIMQGAGATGNLSENTRRKIFANLSEQSEMLDNGQRATVIQRFQYEHPDIWQRVTAEIFTITDGFKDFSALGKSQANAQVKKGIANLEKALKRGSGSYSGGSYSYANNLSGDNRASNDEEYIY